MLKFSILFLLLSVLNNLQAQEYSFAVITEPQIGAQENAENLLQAVDDINKRENISQVIVLGNITENGKFDEFIWAQEILDGLNVPYCVVGGDKDYILSDGKGYEISLLWNDKKKIIQARNASLICINTILPEYSNKNYIEAETVSWLENELNKSSANKIITFSYLPLSRADNSFKFFEVTLDKKIFSFVSRADKSATEIPSFEGFYLNRNDDWGYLIVSIKKDSLLISKMIGSEIKKKSKPEIIKSVFGSTTLYQFIKPEKKLSLGNVLWTVENNRSINNSPSFKNDKILAGFKNGQVTCFSESGIEKWNYKQQEKIISTPLIENDIAVVSTVEGDILTLNSNTGELAQVIGIGESITSNIKLIDFDGGGVKRKAVVTGTVYGNLYCYDLYSLVPNWTAQVSGESINSSIAYSNNKIFFSDKSGTMYCISASNGLLIWKIDPSQGGWNNLSVRYNLIISDFNLFTIDVSGNLFCIDVLLGNVKWKIKNLNSNGLIRLNKKNELLIPSTKNKISIISQKSGKVTNEIELPSETKSEMITNLGAIEDKIIIGFSNGWVYQINSKKKVEKMFRSGSAPIISILNVNGNCLVTDYDGKITLLEIPNTKK
jgi:outer membrane protein assembly factor BamB